MLHQAWNLRFGFNGLLWAGTLRTVDCLEVRGHQVSSHSTVLFRADSISIDVPGCPQTPAFPTWLDDGITYARTNKKAAEVLQGASSQEKYFRSSLVLDTRDKMDGKPGLELPRSLLFTSPLLVAGCCPSQRLFRTLAMEDRPSGNATAPQLSEIKYAMHLPIDAPRCLSRKLVPNTYCERGVEETMHASCESEVSGI